eukprot:TRINITY_DN0_c474_g1_i3.p1 TRINITY_DN0_c474_g1~~TRINITY_DN0_c474_g1_i3.p1  ORF type:complete len:103 (+),score=46.26 TRINITY_DN0_c474_g1_i3:1-309(+)
MCIRDRSGRGPQEEELGLGAKDPRSLGVKQPPRLGQTVTGITRGKNDRREEEDRHPLRLIDPGVRQRIEDNLYLNYKSKLRERFIQHLKEESELFLEQLDLA